MKRWATACAGYDAVYKKIEYAITAKKSLPLTAVHCTAQTGEYVFSPLKEIYPCWEVVGNKKFQIGIIENNTISWNKDELKNGIPMMLLLCLVNIVNMSSCVVEDAWR